MFKSIKRFIIFVLFALLIATVIIFFPKFEWNSPRVEMIEETSTVGSKPFEIKISDEGQGLKKVYVSLLDKRGETLIAEKEYPQPRENDTITINLGVSEIGVKDGPAKIKVFAEDYSKFRFFSGNKTTKTVDIVVDVTPPSVSEISGIQYINHGGSGLLIYRVSDDVVKSGVTVGKKFFKGYKGYFNDPQIYLCFFAYPYYLDDDADIRIKAIDAAGNERILPVYYSLKDANYNHRNIQVSERFIQRKMVPLLKENISDNTDLKEVFLKVNNEMRKRNNHKISEVTSDSTDKILWDRKFLQLSNSKVESNFADRRTYRVQGEEIDQQHHLGYDLSVTKQYPVEAANNGIVVYAEDLGIYGNTVIIDHGMGLMTLYSHLSSIAVNKGDNISKGEILGRTGVTGLAGGDHLHFGVYVQGIPVRPIEWWDQKWINDNILLKIKEARARSGAGN